MVELNVSNLPQDKNVVKIAEIKSVISNTLTTFRSVIKTKVGLLLKLERHLIMHYRYSSRFLPLPATRLQTFRTSLIWFILL